MFDTPHRAPLERVVFFGPRAIKIWPRCGQEPKQHTITPLPKRDNSTPEPVRRNFLITCLEWIDLFTVSSHRGGFLDP
jgi:hypothetical protein